MKEQRPQTNIPPFLADTWWYGMTTRFSDKEFVSLAKKRKEQGFSAIQIVVGIPPEVGLSHPSAASEYGPAWNLRGEVNKHYLDYARKRVETLNSLGLLAIIYGAWGYQIEWLGVEGMVNWWKEIIRTLDKLDVLYCLTGESDLWVRREKQLLPNKTTDMLGNQRVGKILPGRVRSLIKRAVGYIESPLFVAGEKERQQKWSNVLASVRPLTNKPFLIHPLPGEVSEDIVRDPEALDAVTVQTGHDKGAKNQLWQLPYEAMREYPQKPFINLEPWYEGIRNDFYTGDQLYAYWSSMMSGATAYCYGAHGIWNGGDGKFLAHWGKQTFSQAVKLVTPGLLGKSHEVFTSQIQGKFTNIQIVQQNNKLLQITRQDSHKRCIHFIPDVTKMYKVQHEGEFFDPISGEWKTKIPQQGPVVIFPR